MYDETYGLRFDIYERVHLSDEVVGIDQLEEVELTPHIQIIPSGEQVTVRGSLLLSGAYVGISENEHNQSLEHWIPVEITLPLSRVRSLEEIHVDIEHFDVDLLSTRSLNITGVLSLKGIYLENQEVPAWQQEQFTVEYESTRKASDEPEWLRDYGQPPQKDNNLTSDISSYNYDGGTAAISSFEQDSVSSAPSPDVESVAPGENHVQYPSQWIGDGSNDQAAANWSWSGQGEGIQADASTVQQREQQSELHPVTGTESTWTWDQSPWGSASIATQDHAAGQQEANYGIADAAYTEEVVREQESEPAAIEDLILSSGSEQPELHTSPQLDNEFEERDLLEAEEQLHSEKKEMKVAIGSSSPSTNGEVSQGLGFSKLLHSSKQARDKEREVEERQAREEAAQLAQKISDDVHWQSLFLNQLPDESSFRKVRLCIVQRQDTLDSIAARYQLNAREIALYNRLPESIVTEGQVIYIPS
ncbi:LysM peptidoglycan-binding domain-containing protein [Paenibacillus sp. SC116]|uniref:LysM peptidoglycan-binding domain-containing protein n=1 Tax=Paenibacillus sp. SC116 TaxID=2968986 RepID=UPI00215B0F2A|nr:LysM peptidoglycan-binding domain-containing protein [Paenibacillus sp. SC116]MCR8846240.1 LysM peptidoglycan-binding domain-containing protein [Paenibacillus sp. SC116]